MSRMLCLPLALSHGAPPHSLAPTGSRRALTLLDTGPRRPSPQGHPPPASVVAGHAQRYQGVSRDVHPAGRSLPPAAARKKATRHFREAPSLGTRQGASSGHQGPMDTGSLRLTTGYSCTGLLSTPTLRGTNWEQWGQTWGQ